VAHPIGREFEHRVDRPVRAAYRSTVTGLSLGGLSLWQLVRSVWNSSLEDGVVDRAAELAYYFLFALFPALIFLSAMFSVFASTQTRSNVELLLYLGRVIPPSAFDVVKSTFAETAKSAAAGDLAFGAITALWAATYGMSSAQSVLNTVYRVRERRPYWKAKCIAVAMTLAIFVLVFGAMLLLLVGNYIAKLLVSDWLVNGSVMVGWKIVQVVASIFFMMLVFSITYRWGPDVAGQKWRWITPGSIVGIFGWLIVSVGFRFYLHYFNNYTALYGSVGAIIVLLTWFYVSGLMLLVGAEINAAIDRAVADQKPT